MQGKAPCFITVLGTSDYLDCAYYAHPDRNTRVHGVRFVQEAVLRLHGELARPDAKILVLLTEKARKANWEDGGHKQRDNGGPVEGLRTRLQGVINAPPETVDIPMGRNEEEIWQIFRLIVDAIPEEASLWVDITHSFRSLGMILLAAIQYVKAVKQVQVRAIHYGAMEAVGTVQELRALPPEERVVPIFDLTPFNAIMDWSQAVANFRRSGDPGLLHELSREPLRTLLANSKGKDEAAKAIRYLVDSISALCSHLSCNRGPKISRLAQRVNTNLARVRKNMPANHVLPPLSPLFDMLAKEFAGFTGDSLDVALAAADWCQRHNFIPQAYTILQEGVFSWCLQQANHEDLCDVKAREAASAALYIVAQSLEYDEWHKEAKAQRELIERIRALPGIEAMAKLADQLTQRRNDINHGGHKSDSVPPDRLKGDLETQIQALRDWKKKTA